MAGREDERGLEIATAILGEKLDNLIISFEKHSQKLDDWQKMETQRHEALEKRMGQFEIWKAEHTAQWKSHKEFHQTITEDVNNMQRKNRAYDWLVGIVSLATVVLSKVFGG